MKPATRVGCGLLGALLVTSAAAQIAAPTPSRGKLLYDTHCVACHTTEMHWRDNKAATDWNSMLQQVRLWQHWANLGWTADDIAEVARHLNETLYRHPVSGEAIHKSLLEPHGPITSIARAAPAGR